MTLDLTWNQHCFNINVTHSLSSQFPSWGRYDCMGSSGDAFADMKWMPVQFFFCYLDLVKACIALCGESGQITLSPNFPQQLCCSAVYHLPIDCSLPDLQQSAAAREKKRLHGWIFGRAQWWILNLNLAWLAILCAKLLPFHFKPGQTVIGCKKDISDNGILTAICISSWSWFCL